MVVAELLGAVVMPKEEVSCNELYLRSVRVAGDDPRL
jgi:hypothetical protein